MNKQTEDINKMSETKTETKQPERFDAIDDNVALLKSKILMLEKAVTEKDEHIEMLTTKLSQATEFIEGDQKKMILAEIKPKVDIPDEILMLKSLDELKQMKKILDVTRVQSFKSGTPVGDYKKPTARTRLDNKFLEAQAKRMGGNK